MTPISQILAAGKGWLAGYPDNKEFWIDQGTGRWLCSLMEAILASDPKPFAPNQPLREVIDALLGSMVRMGIAEAHRLEESLRSYLSSVASELSGPAESNAVSTT